MKSQSDPIKYRIDAKDRIISISGGWDEFAVENGGAELLARRVIGRSLWDFLAGDDVKRLNRLIIDDIRGNIGRSIAFRCDGPATRRYFRLKGTPFPRGEIEFESIEIKTEPQPDPVKGSSAARRDEWTVICSWCKRARAADMTWSELRDEAVLEALFSGKVGDVKISHGVCDDCFRVVMDQLVDEAGTTEDPRSGSRPDFTISGALRKI